ncbi:hypothetical protein B1H18_11270 [Streptomyces tsukubensis]|uniref:Uncharacterized protein n=1 Tax=Streptomyces tsukubensis TaxID=83656 RepID=A0A1V4AAW0_9ACTN|nr:hypothetical protein B1H18_11270 [Streptomyces tsukubensis]
MREFQAPGADQNAVLDRTDAVLQAAVDRAAGAGVRRDVDVGRLRLLESRPDLDAENGVESMRSVGDATPPDAMIFTCRAPLRTASRAARRISSTPSTIRPMPCLQTGSLSSPVAPKSA